MRNVVVNSTPLIILCGIGQLELLKKLYEEIYIPRAVYQEVTAKKDSACMQIENATSWIHVVEILNSDEKKMYKAKLHEGEVEVMIWHRRKWLIWLYWMIMQQRKRQSISDLLLPVH